MSTQKTKWVLLITIITWITSLYLIFELEYLSFTQKVAAIYYQEHHIDRLREQYLTPTRFVYLKWLGGVLVGLVLTSTYWFVVVFEKQKLLAKLASIKSSLRHLALFSRSLNYGKKILLCLPLVIYVASWWLYEWHVDELFSFVFLMDRGILTCMIYYPGPNNHVGYSVFSALLHYVLPPIIASKLPATLFAWIALLIIWHFFYSRKEVFLSWIVLFLVTSSGYFFFYASHGRGYSLLVLMFALQSVAAYKVLSNQNNSRWWWVWTLVNVWGTYTIPTFVYACIASFFGVCLIGRSTNYLKQLLKYSFFSGFLSLMLYAPIILFNGLDAIIANDFIISHPFHSWIKYLPTYWWSVHRETGAIALFISLFLYSKEPHQRKAVIYFWSIVFLPYFLLAIQGVFPFERIWIYRKVSELIMIIWGGYHISKDLAILRKKSFVLFFKVFAVILLGVFLSKRIYYEYRHWKVSPNIYQKTPTLAKLVYEQEPSSILVLEDTYNVFLRYAFRERVIPIDTSPKLKEYEIVICLDGEEFPLPYRKDDYTKFYEDQFVKAYRLIKPPNGKVEHSSKAYPK